MIVVFDTFAIGSQYLQTRLRLKSQLCQFHVFMQKGAFTCLRDYVGATVVREEIIKRCRDNQSVNNDDVIYDYNQLAGDLRLTERLLCKDCQNEIIDTCDLYVDLSNAQLVAKECFKNICGLELNYVEVVS